MGPLRSVDRIGGDLHPTQRPFLCRALRGGEILRERVPRRLPLASLVARFRKAKVAARAGRGVDEVQPEIGMVGVAEDLRCRRGRARCASS